MKFLALGDSYTIGELVDASDRFPACLVRKIGQHRVELDVPHIIAKTGWTTTELLAAIGDNKPSDEYDLVTLLIGVNNQYQSLESDLYEKEFEDLLQLAIEFAGSDANRVIVVSIPDYGVTPFIAGKEDRDAAQIAVELDAYNQTARDISKRYKTHWVDVTEISRTESHKDGLLASDGLHPSGVMYSLWATEIEPIAVSIVGPRVSDPKLGK
jgi:lysophospholipase L1-like esterase